VTQGKGFGLFNLGGKWKKTYRGFTTKEPWLILTSFADVKTAITAYQKRFDIEEMFRDFKSGGSLGYRVRKVYFDTLLIDVYD
jgi:hypothetical protein